MNSWDKTDSYPAVDCGKCGKIERDGICTKENRDCTGFECFEVGPNDLSLMTALCNSGTDHRKFMRMITVYLDITAPLYWWKEFDTYKVGTVANSCSTMHKIADRDFTLDDFSHEHLDNTKFILTNNVKGSSGTEQRITASATIYFKTLIAILNHYRKEYVRTKDKNYWWQLIQLLPSSYNQKRTIMLNYEVLANMYVSRRYHKLDEWVTFSEWIESLPYSGLITGNWEFNNNGK